MRNNIKKVVWTVVVFVYTITVFVKPEVYADILKPQSSLSLMMYDLRYADKNIPLLLADFVYSIFSQEAKVVFNAQTQEEAENLHSINTREKQIINGGNTSYNKISISNTTNEKIDIKSLMENYSLIKNRENFKILIIHSHGTEAYENSKDAREEEFQQNVVGIGMHLEKELEKYGFDVLHDVKMHDKDDYNKSYTNSLGTTKWYLENYDDIGIIIDLHRDAIESETGERIKLTYDTGQEKAAQLMMVVGSNGGGLTHDNYLENLKFAIALQKEGQDMYEGLLRPINFRDERFNQHLHKNYIILEVGTHGNTVKEAKMGCELFARILNKAIK